MLQKLLFMIKSSVAINTVVLHIQANSQRHEKCQLDHVHPPARIYQRDSHWPKLREIPYWGLVWKSVEKSKHG